MAYSKAYQQIVSGRTREDELAFFKQNQSVSPAKVYGHYPTGGKSEPTIVKDLTDDNFVGKASSLRKPVLSCYKPNSYHS